MSICQVAVVSSSLLDDAINKLLKVNYVSKHTPSDAAGIFVAATILTTQLKKDQLTIQSLRTQDGDETLFPSFHEIPAISAVIQNPVLYRSLLSCILTVSGSSLSSSSSNELNEILALQNPSQQLHPPSQQQQHTHSTSFTRKRAFSTVSETIVDRANKALKIHHSPVPTLRTNKLHNVNTDASRKLSSAFDKHVFAAIILYYTFQHIDHWPEGLAQAYAEDSFGPRLWVDDARCSNLVDEICFSLGEYSSNDSDDTTILANAELASQFYRRSEDQPLDSSSEPGDGRGRSRTLMQAPIPKPSLIKAQNSTTSQDSTKSSSSHVQDSSESQNDKSHSPNKPQGSNDTNMDPFLDSILRQRLSSRTIRRRYFGANLLAAERSIVSSLRYRLEQKSKQNSGLLQSLPTFTSISTVRFIISQNLEQWLKSPALAGLARSLFALVVTHMKNVDPPLEDDLRAINCILDMKLKSNQLNAHIENVTAIARQLPVAAVAHHMYSLLLKEFLKNDQSEDSFTANELRMICSIHREIDPLISYESFATVFLTVLVEPIDHSGGETQKATRSERHQLVYRIRWLIRTLSSQLGTTFDGHQLIEALLSLDVSSESWSKSDEEDKARIMFQCAIQTVDIKKNELNSTAVTSNTLLRQSLSKSRKLLLSWYCSDFGPRFKGKLRNLSDSEEVGAGIPDFDSALMQSSQVGSVPSWLRTMRCLLFLEDGDSEQMQRFMVPESLGSEGEWDDDATRITVCHKFGGGVTDEMIWIVLKSASETSTGIDATMAISLLENMFANCAKERNGTLKVCDPMIVWELYNLVQYEPTKIAVSTDDIKILDDMPRLAYPGLWWRVTMLALIMCSTSTKDIGSVVWNDHPTLKSLMKMITANRFRFPTVDCDDAEKAIIKAGEQSARAKEANAAEYLFLPKESGTKKQDNKGQRVSRRILKQQQEREAALEHAELLHRKNILQTSQKSIMLWDPDGPARKPPRESEDLLVSVKESFSLSLVFQASIEPDFLLMTIGQTTRETIERAYDWLLPIISTVETTISRLPSNASCFLLLRAYGTEGEERKQLKKLSAPLLVHVRESLAGKYGESDSVNAFELLMSDVASTQPDRRRHARRVLHDALEGEQQFDDSRQSWMNNILYLSYSQSLVPIAIKHLSVAAGFECGKPLRSILTALKEMFRFAIDKDFEVTGTFVDRLTSAISYRPQVCAETMSNFPDFWIIVIEVLFDEIEVKKGSFEKQKTKSSPVSLELLQSVCVCLSVWKDEEVSISDEFTKKLGMLADFTFGSINSPKETNQAIGIDASWHTETLDIESWVLLAKARSSVVAKRAASSAPLNCLCRMLMSSGLPSPSLLTMIDRLGKAGESSTDKEKFFLELVDAKASSEWDIGRVGNRGYILRKLLGRLSAYFRLNDSLKSSLETSRTFLVWLSEECMKRKIDNDLKRKSKKGKETLSAVFQTITSASSLLSVFTDNNIDPGKKMKLSKGESELNEFFNVSNSPKREEMLMDDDGGQLELEYFIETANHIELEVALLKIVKSVEPSPNQHAPSNTDIDDVCTLCLNALMSSSSHDGIAAVILKFIPLLTRYRQVGPGVWKILFGVQDDASKRAALDSLVCKFVAVWSKQHTCACTQWILSLSKSDIDDLAVERLTYFLVTTSDLGPNHLESCTGITPIGKNELCNSKGGLLQAGLIGLRCLKKSDQKDYTYAIYSRNNLPLGLTLLILLAKAGKQQLQTLAELIIQEKAESDLNPDMVDAFGVILLRLYVLHPYWMDLGSAGVRQNLVRATELSASYWIHWKSTMDDVITDYINTLLSGDSRISRLLSDLSRWHPLLILRRLPTITEALELDATASTNGNTENDRGVVTGYSVEASPETRFDSKNVKLSIKHWGFSFMEPIWSSVLDIVSVIPREVLFTCGTKVGLFDFLNVYIQLLSVQLSLTSATKVNRLKGKLSECFTVFQQCNAKGYSEWLSSRVGNVEVRQILLSSGFISPEHAMESLRRPGVGCHYD